MVARFKRSHGGHLGSGATFLIAASDSLMPARADYVCDGRNDQEEIQDAIDRVTAIGGGRVILLEGTFSCLDNIALQTGVTLEGQGPSATKIELDGTPTTLHGFLRLMAPRTDMAVKNLQVNSKSYAYYALTIDGTGFPPTSYAERVLIEDCWFIIEAGVTDDIIEVERVKHCTLRNIYTSGTFPEMGITTNANLEIGDYCEDVYVENFHALATTEDGIGLSINWHEALGAERPKRITVNGLYTKGMDYLGLFIQGEKVTVTNLHLYDCGHTGIFIQGAIDVTIDGFEIENVQRYGMQLYGTGIRIANGVVKDPSQEAGAWAAIYCQSPVQIDNVEILQTEDKTGAGLYVRGEDFDVAGMLVNNLRVEGLGEGKAVWLYKADYGIYSNLFLKDNCQDANNTYSVIKLEGAGGVPSVYNRFSGVTILETATHKAKYGIEETAATDDHNIIQGCSFNGVVTAGVLQSGVNSLVRDNKGYLASGEERIASGVLASGNADAFAFVWQNPHAQKIIVTKVVIDVTTAGGTGGSVLAVGSAAGATTGSDNILDDDGGIDLNATGIYNSIDHAGTNGVQGQKVDENGGTTDYITGQILTQNAGSLVGKYYIYYTGV